MACGHVQIQGDTLVVVSSTEARAAEASMIIGKLGISTTIDRSNPPQLNVKASLPDIWPEGFLADLLAVVAEISGGDPRDMLDKALEKLAGS